MNHLKSFKQKISYLIVLAILIPGLIAFGTFILLNNHLLIDPPLAAIISVIVCVVLLFLSFVAVSKIAIRPIEMIWQAVWHISPNSTSTTAPKTNNLTIGKGLVEALLGQVYDLASSNPASLQEAATPAKTGSDLLENLPVGVVSFDKELSVIATNTLAAEYIGETKDQLIGKNINEVLNLSFSSDDTLELWLNESKKSRATASQTWGQVKLVGKKLEKQIDLSAYYSRDDVSGNEVVIALLDKSDSYGQQDQASSYVALAVHELRTPLTMLRGYIELFEEELGDELNDEQREFMKKMSASSQNLAAFVNNILNVARINEDQFVVRLQEEDWSQALTEIVDSMQLRAQVKRKVIKLEIQPDLPKVGIDKISMFEVIGNLLDNAIKYSGQSADIKITAKLNKEGLVETTVEDHGPGIPQSIIGQLFTKYYRSHRSKNAVGGSGLGLYLVKSIVNAHGGNVWVKSKEGEGSKFGFTLIPYANLSKEEQSTSKDGIERQAGGWIKNHSLYRR